MSVENYSLAGENEKLAARAKIFDKQSKFFLPNIIRPGQKILEIGCGMGGATMMIANILDNTGFIHAIDINSEYVSYVKNKLASDGYHNFEIQQARVEDLVVENHYDLIYGRAVLHHIPNAKKLMSQLLSYMKPAGLFAFEEPIVTSVFAQPANHAYTQLLHWYKKLGVAKGADYNIGEKLSIYFQELQVKILECKFIQIALLEPIERIALLELIPTLQQQFIEYSIATIEEINDVKIALGSLVYSNQMMFHGQFCQILGQKTKE